MSREKILNNIKDNIAIENFRTINRKHEKTKKILQSTLTVAMCSLSITGIVFAKDISNQIYNKYFTGKGVEKAINEGYVENTKMEEQSSNSTIQDKETGKIIEDNETKVKVSEIIMDDFTLSMTFEVTLSDKVKDIITAQDVMEMNFPDVVIYDENNNILNSVYGDYLKKFSKKNNITPKEVIGSGVNIFVSEKNENTVKVIYNFYTGGECVYPKSKELHIDMNKINISKNETVMGDEEISIKGNWNFKVDVPEKMYNRQNIVYRQKSTSNKDFNVESAILYNTGMEIKMKFKAEKQLSMQEIETSISKELQFYWSLDKNDELRNIDILNYLESKERDNPEYQKLMRQEMEKWKFDKYLTNSNGQRFDFTVGPRENGSAYIDDDGIMTSTCMFDLTKYDATDEITLHLEYKGNKADIVLEKVEQ